MNFNHFNKEKSDLQYKGIVSSIYHRKFSKGIYEYVVMSDVVRVLAFTKEGKVLVNKEKLFADKEDYYALPGGGVEKGEDPSFAIKRELKEETGYVSDELIPWFDANYSQTIISRKYFFIAKNCKKVSNQNLEESENIIVEEMEFDKFLEVAISNDFKHIDLQVQFLKMKYDNSYKKSFKKKYFNE